jgi:peroxiredoxin
MTTIRLVAALLLSAGIAAPLLAQPPAHTARPADPSDTISPEARAVLDRAAAAYHALKTFQDSVEIETVFDLSAGDNAHDRLISHKALRLRWTSNPWRFALKGANGCIYGDAQTFTTLDYGRADDKGAFHPEYEHAKAEFFGDGVYDWRDLTGMQGRLLEPDAVSELYMSGPKSTLDLFRRVAEVVPGELDERPGVWLRGKGPCPHSPGAGGTDITPMSAWFSAKTGLIREIRYDISGTGWATGAAAGFGDRHNSEGSVKAEVVVRYLSTAANEPVDESLITDNTSRPVERIQAARAGVEAIPAMGTGGMKKPAGMAGMSAAKPAAEPEVERSTDKLIDQPAPALAGKAPDGSDVNVADYKGKVVLVDFWATWCGPCMQGIPCIQRLHEKYKDQGVAVLGVNRDKRADESLVRKTLERKSLTFGQVMDAEGVIAKAYKISAIPATFLIDKQGIIRAVHIGYGPGGEQLLAREIDKLHKGEKLAPARKNNPPAARTAY